MNRVREILETHPKAAQIDVASLADCIAECFQCAQSCTSCADACLNEDDPDQMVACIRADLDCADVCVTTGRALSRLGEPDVEVLRALVGACETACRVCGNECERRGGMHRHCRVCAESCRRCEQACARVLEAVAAAN